MPVNKSTAIVIGKYPLRENDRIVVFLTRNFGKIRAVAKGAANFKSKFCGRLEILTCGELLYFQRAGKDLHSVNSFDVIEPFQMLREDLLKMAYCCYIAELIQHAIVDEEPDQQIFDLTLSIMSMMATTNDPEIIAKTFEIKLLNHMGLNPRLDSCIECSAEIKSTAPKFSIQAGGVLCEKCSDSGNQGIKVSRGSLETIRKIQESPLDFISRLRVSDLSKHEIDKILSGFIAFHMDVKNLRSLSFLESIKSEYAK